MNQRGTTCERSASGKLFLCQFERNLGMILVSLTQETRQDTQSVFELTDLCAPVCVAQSTDGLQDVSFVAQSTQGNRRLFEQKETFQQTRNVQSYVWSTHSKKNRGRRSCFAPCSASQRSGLPRTISGNKTEIPP